MKNRLTSYPVLIKEWHPLKNGSLEPAFLSHGSKVLVWWKCSKNPEHEWQSRPLERASKGQGCPYCSGNKPSKTYNLRYCNPEVSKQWHPVKNISIKPENFTPGSNQKVWWKCPVSDDHEWEASIKSRARLGRGCPYCAGKRPSKTNNLVSQFPLIAKEWHPTKNGNLLPTDVTHSTVKKVWWICPSGHEYIHSINQRTTRVKLCPYCSGYRLDKTNNLKALFPKISEEWHPTKNKDLKPEQLHPGTRKKVWFICPKGHEYKTQVQFRTRSGSGCPFCTNSTSRHELRILSEIELLFKDTEHRKKIKGHEFDVFVPSLNLAIEYDGGYWHEKKEDADRLKNKFCKNENIFLIRVRQLPLKKIEKQDIIVTKKRELDKQDLNMIIDEIKKYYPNNKNRNLFNLYFLERNFQNENAFGKYKNYLPSPPLKKSLLTTHPKISSFWEFEKNYPLKPENFSHGSNRKVFWKCTKGHIFEKSIDSITRGEWCPYCAGKRVSKTNNLRHNFPEIAAEWHPTKNSFLKPENFAKFSHKRVWWLCKINPIHEWEVSIASRTSRGKTWCPHCYKNNKLK